MVERRVAWWQDRYHGGWTDNTVEGRVAWWRDV